MNLDWQRIRGYNTKRQATTITQKYINLTSSKYFLCIETVKKMTLDRKRGDICIHITDSLCSIAETNNIVKQLYSNKDF